MRRTKKAQTGAHRQGVIKDLLLFVCLFGYHQDGLAVDRREPRRIARLHCSRQQVFVLAEHLPDGLEQRCLVILEVEMQNDERPLTAPIFCDDLFHNGTHLLEEIVLQCGFLTCWVGRVGDDNATFAGRWINVPGKVLLDGYRKAGVESSLNTIIPMSLVGIAVMRIQNGLVVIQEVQIRPLCKSTEGAQDDYR